MLKEVLLPINGILESKFGVIQISSGAGYRQTPAEAATVQTGAARQLPDSLQVRDSVSW